MEEPEPATIRAATAGDLDAFEDIVRAYQVPVWRFLRQLLGDASLAEDVTQETFVRVFERLASFSGRSKFSTWLLQVARNAGTDALRRRARHHRLTEALPVPRPVAAADSGSELVVALQSLSAKLREAVLVVEIFGMSYREAASVLAVPEGTVKSRVAEGRRQLLGWLAAGERADEM
ncbi:MAG TPA: RNA polymerase sigma factor [Acidimicrobiales bacterium]|nr:RNA polymerase sigma factor [Acidimicrobiales bacterium]